MKLVKTIRTVVGYTALAIGVTVGGVAIGATVVAPMVAAIVGPSTAPARSVEMLRLTKDFVNAMPNFDRIPNTVWLFVAGAAALALVAAVGWNVHTRVTRAAPGAFDLASLGASAMPTTLVSGKNRTPRAVQALAEAGTTPADIARRTGLPLDAVVLCLAMPPIGARQLRPPTA